MWCVNCGKRAMATSIDDLKSAKFWRAVFAEFLGTMFLVLVGCGTCLGGASWEKAGADAAVQISLAFGLIVGTMVWCIAHVSGGHVNPAVTVSMLVTRKISIVRALLYIVSQCFGATSGAGILSGLTPDNTTGGGGEGNLGMTLVDEHLSPAYGFLVELLITMVLVLTVFASCDSKRKDLNGSAPLSIGLSVTVCHLWAIKYTGSSMNPARTFGPAVVSGIWTHHWVYWCGPILGGIFAALIYETVFAANASLKRTVGFLTDVNFEDKDDIPVKEKELLGDGKKNPKDYDGEVAISNI